jgi:hypothetical protein
MPRMTGSEPVETRDRARSCGYEPCARDLPPYSGRGRPQRYCRDRRWPGGKTCQQMAEAQRAAELAAGLDVPLAAYRSSTGTFVETATALGERLDEVLDAVRAVDGGALARIAAAEQAMVDAVTRAQAAEAERDQAHRDRQAALADRARAQEAAAEADRRATAARRDADHQIRAALDRVADAERDRGQALATATAAGTAQERETRRREDAERHAATAAAEARALRERLDEVRAAEADLRTRLAEAAGRADLAAGDAVRQRQRADGLAARAEAAERDRGALARRMDEVAGERDAARAERDTVRAERDAARTAADQVTRELAAARVAAEHAAGRLATADARVDQLLAALAVAHRQARPGESPSTDPAAGVVAGQAGGRGEGSRDRVDVPAGPARAAGSDRRPTG